MSTPRVRICEQSCRELIGRIDEYNIYPHFCVRERDGEIMDQRRTLLRRADWHVKKQTNEDMPADILCGIPVE